MKNRSITQKLFIITALLLFLFLALTLAFQTAFFEKFYINRKSAHLKNNLAKFSESYAGNHDDIKAVSQEMYKFSDDNNCEMLISQKNGNGYFVISSLLNMTAPSTVTLPAGNVLTVTPLADDPIKREVMLQALNYWETQLKNNAGTTGKIFKTIFQHPYLDSSYVILISSGANSNYAIIAVSSLQPIGEAANVIREFYIYIFAAAAVLIIVFSLIYTNMIAKPLVALNKTAEKMLDMDFTARCDVNTQDEIGSLGNTLNFLSNRLNITLSDLKSANVKLKRDIDKERALEKLRKEFVADVSHELKTPISLIKGYAEGLKDGVVDGRDKDFYIDVIIDESDKMGYLVSDMLNLAQLEAGKVQLNCESFNIIEATSQLVKKYQNSLQQKNIRLETNIKDECLDIFADRRKIEQVITNFLSNAIRHTPEQGSISITIAGLKSAVFWGIENSGEPIEEGEMSKIWDKFYRIDKSRNKQLGGTGLGLAIVKNILEAHGFKYGIRNTGTGVMFYFEVKNAE